MAARAPRRVGVDTGGTFTDLVLPERGDAGGAPPRVVKLPSTPDDPGRAVESALDAALGAGARARVHVVHGTTVALNALLERRVARAALVTGEGFLDLIEIGRQNRPDIYALHPEKPPPLVPRERRFEVPSRAWPDPATGALVRVRRPSPEELERLVRAVRASGAESVAVCLLHSFADPADEREVAAALAPLGIPVTCSGELAPEHREYERFSTAVANAALAPLMRRYLGALEPRLGGARLSLLQSSGGTLAAERAALEPVRVVLSGPAGGVVGAARAAREAGLGPLVALDVGGTSTDVAFHPGAGGTERRDGARQVRSAEVAGIPLLVPALDIHTVGCGGGSLVRVDDAGGLHVGPESAGADPGPVCYGRSDRPTVTDAHVLLGQVREGLFLDGALHLDVDAVARAFEALGRRLGAEPVAVARAVLAAARAAMRRALSVMTMQRGEDPRRLALVAFGGAGGLCAAELARSLDMPGALVPASPGALSALGMAAATASREAAVTVLEPLAQWPRARRRAALAAPARELARELAAEGHARRAVVAESSLDLRYRGQSFELALQDGPDLAARFHAEHERMYGYALPEREVELVCLRARAAAAEELPPALRVRSRRLPARAVTGEAAVDFGRRARAALVDRRELAPGHALEGPAVVLEYSGTTLVPPGFRARVTAGGHLWIEARRRR